MNDEMDETITNLSNELAIVTTLLRDYYTENKMDEHGVSQHTEEQVLEYLFPEEK